MKTTSELVAAGLLSMRTTPAALVLVDCLDIIWDHPEICGVRVYHAAEGFTPPYYGCDGDTACPFFPVWAADNAESLADTRRFVRAYCEEA